MPLWLQQKLWVPDTIRRNLPGYDKEIVFAEHHESHAASAFFPSPFERAAVLTVDGVGEWTTTSIGVGEGAELRFRQEIHFPHSLGLLYSAFTYHIGFRVNSGEYKVMGLAPYGKPPLRRSDLQRAHRSARRRVVPLGRPGLLRLLRGSDHDQRSVLRAVRRSPAPSRVGDRAAGDGPGLLRPGGLRGGDVAARSTCPRGERL